MSAKIITADDLIRWYADDVAFVAEEAPAGNLGAFIGQLNTVALRFSDAGINGSEDLETAAIVLNEAINSADDGEADRNAFLRRAETLLAPVVWDMTQEYRDMAGA